MASTRTDCIVVRSSDKVWSVYCTVRLFLLAKTPIRSPEQPDRNCDRLVRNGQHCLWFQRFSRTISGVLCREANWDLHYYLSKTRNTVCRCSKGYLFTRTAFLAIMQQTTPYYALQLLHSIQQLIASEKSQLNQPPVFQELSWYYLPHWFPAHTTLSSLIQFI